MIASYGRDSGGNSFITGMGAGGTTRNGVPMNPATTGTASTNLSDIYGSRVGQIPNVNGPSLSSVYPNLSGTNADVSSALASELTGKLSPQTMNQIMDASAAYGVNSGMPGGGLAANKYPRDIGLTSEQLISQGLGHYSSVIPAVSSTQTVNPGQQAQLNTDINATNAVNAASPDPAAAGTYAQQLFDKYLKSMSSPAGGTGSGANSGQPWWSKPLPRGATAYTPGVAGGGAGDASGIYFR